MEKIQNCKSEFLFPLVKRPVIQIEGFDLDEKCKDDPVLLWYARDLFRLFQSVQPKSITPSNTFLATRWNCGISKVNCLLSRMESLKIITRKTSLPRQGIDGWRQHRSLVIHLAYSVRKITRYVNKKTTTVVKTKPQQRSSPQKLKHSLPIARDALLSKQHVSRKWLAQLLKNLGANHRTVGYGLCFHSAVQHHPEVLEAWLEEITQPSVRKPIGMLIHHMKEYAWGTLPPP